ncbi:ABC transporter ATP-binding protein [Kytococcus sedentarius]|uniref:ABC-type multidrug transport system, ATPase and permease component n=1 Tax=Kytococcus sedentarius (strain ATCC 14392 / DSM 20547 / JCM 11482 / CCUG 33030 / NBRC 15357 / NCTC 11040 / CCM 314 / 541) TaxID=478801 RepID=C7NEZ5_KYTSD|nr:ABC transporter ATP-binding protein [Kytococcus sedentarius]ACV05819.1 ABC-type multidrug transport system, ATPase and permease component [Kytococcus sedentarius DSM 20547]STX12767.1 Putative multidrug export ATP-binding/permease protein SAV1866 [Kytococcus sedentarius]
MSTHTAPTTNDPADDPTGVQRMLPIADMASVRRHTASTLARHRSPLVVMALLHGLAAALGLVTPWIIGRIVDGLTNGSLLGDAGFDRGLGLVAGMALAILGQTVASWFANRASFVLGEEIFADLREEFMARVVRLPLSTVERAGTGDLLSRTTGDVESLSYVVRFGLPSILVGTVTLVVTVIASVVTSPVVALALVVIPVILFLPTRWYLRRAPRAYARERAQWARLNGVVSESVEGARTVEALQLQARRRAVSDEVLSDILDAEKGTLRLRLWWFPSLDLAFNLPAAVALLWGGVAVSQGWASIGEVTAVVLYVQMLHEPLSQLLGWLDELQVAATSLARVIGIADVPADRSPGTARPVGEELTATDVRYHYRPDKEVLHGVSLDLKPGERLAIVGSSGAGKSTLGRLLAGIDGPTQGSVTVGGVPLLGLPLDDLRGAVALVTQEHHVFVGTLEENLRLARPGATEDELWSALDAVDAAWVRALPEALGTTVGSGGLRLTDSRAQQVALARLVLADPHTLVLDEATSLLDPRAARHLERSMGAVMTGRTVVAIAHRLHTAHDADRVAVMEDGRITELGSHDQLVAEGGAYARLWESWRQE